MRLRSENASITPVYFPYRLEKLRGLLWYRDGQLTLTEFSGEHGNARLSAAGKGTFQKDGSWRFQFEGLRGTAADRPRPRPDPGPARAAQEGGGPARSAGAALSDRQPGAGPRRKPGDPIAAGWDLEIGFDQASIDFGLRLQNMFGTLRLVGRHDGVTWPPAAS